MYNNPTYNEKFNLAKEFISNKEFQKGYDILISIVDKSSASWNYLIGIASLNLGYYEQGESYLKKAISIEPENKVYEDAITRYNNNYDNYNRRAHNYNRRRHNDLGGCCCCCCDDCCCCLGDDCCEDCMKLWCLDTCCECFGGDIVGCC